MSSATGKPLGSSFGSRQRTRTMLFATIIFTIQLALALVLTAASAQAADLRLKIPKKTKPTPVQQLNQEGVKALEHNDLATAKRDFYRAYLLDLDDPFTLNNLGYVSELDGEMEKAQQFYDAAAAAGSNATIALSNNPQLEGKEVSKVAGYAVSAAMQVNRLNVAAMGLMARERAPEAEITLRKALKLDPRNPFTLNNLGYALEQEGELEQAVSYYRMAAASNSQAKVVVAANKGWRGRPIAEIALKNENAALRELNGEASADVKITRLNLRGVSALNRNQPGLARQYFQQAYKLDPGNAFSLNNMGYLAETEGDRETAEIYYQKARQANRSGARVMLSTRRNLEGMRLGAVAGQNQTTVENAREQEIAELRALGLPPLPLRTRDQAIVREPASPPAPEPEVAVRVVAVDNPPPEAPPPAAMASPQSRRGARSVPQTVSPGMNPATAPAMNPSPGMSPSGVPIMTPSAQPAPTVQPMPQDETPLFPVIPDDDK